MEFCVPKHGSRQRMIPLHDERQEAHVSKMVLLEHIENRGNELEVLATLTVRVVPDEEIKQVYAKVCAPSPVVI